MNGIGWISVAEAARLCSKMCIRDSFIQTMLDFVIIAFAMFLFIRLLSNLRRKKEDTPLPPPVPSNEEKLLSEIRDLLKKQ